MHKLFGYPYRETNIKSISNMVDEVCEKVGTKCFPPRAKRDKEVKPMLWQEEIQISLGSRKSEKEEDEP